MAASVAIAEGQIAGPGTPSYPTANVGPGASAKWPSAVDDYNLGVAELQAKKYRDAIANFRRVLRVAPREAKVWVKLGLAEQGVGDLDAAHDAYAKAVDLDGDIPARQGLAQTAVRLGEMDEARGQLAELQKRSDACGRRCGDADKVQAAIAAVQDAIAHSPAAPPPAG